MRANSHFASFFFCLDWPFFFFLELCVCVRVRCLLRPFPAASCASLFLPPSLLQCACPYIYVSVAARHLTSLTRNTEFTDDTDADDDDEDDGWPSLLMLFRVRYALVCVCILSSSHCRVFTAFFCVCLSPPSLCTQRKRD